jgi:transmembrane protein 17
MALRVVRVASSLPLQRFLNYSSYYAWAFGATAIAQAVWKTAALDASSRGVAAILPPALAAAWIALEAARLRLGFVGNLQERVPELAAFWLLTLLPVLPLTAFMSFVSAARPLTPLDVAVGVPAVGLQLAQLRLGLPAVRALIRKQTADFYRVCQDEALAREARGRPRGGGGGGGGLSPSYSVVPTAGSSGAAGASDAAIDAAAAGVGVGAILREGARALVGGGSAAAGGGVPAVVAAATATLPGAGTGLADAASGPKAE